MIPRFPRILHVYDSSDLMIDITASIRRLVGRSPVHQIAVKGRFDLVDALDKLVSDGEVFGRAIFARTQSPGMSSEAGPVAGTTRFLACGLASISTAATLLTIQMDGTSWM